MMGRCCCQYLKQMSLSELHNVGTMPQSSNLSMSNKTLVKAKVRRVDLVITVEPAITRPLQRAGITPGPWACRGPLRTNVTWFPWILQDLCMVLRDFNNSDMYAHTNFNTNLWIQIAIVIYMQMPMVMPCRCVHGHTELSMATQRRPCVADSFWKTLRSKHSLLTCCIGVHF